MIFCIDISKFYTDSTHWESFSDEYGVNTQIVLYGAIWFNLKYFVQTALSSLIPVVKIHLRSL